MSVGAAGATAVRVLGQLRRDPRTLALLLLVPCVLVTLLKYVFVDRPFVFDRIGGPLLGLFPFIAMFLVASITMLRERTTGTLERLMTLPLAKLDLLLGYGVAFALVATVQATLVSVVALWLLDLHVTGAPLTVVLLAVGNAVLGMSLGLFLSAFARTEFQAVQFMPAFVFPQLLLSGLFVPRSEMARPLELASYCLPLSYAYDALDRVTRSGALGERGALDVAVVIGATLLGLALGAATLRRRTE
jgi:ABC-2 type transport system permease protein